MDEVKLYPDMTDAERYDRYNPKVYEMFKGYADRARRRGFKQYSSVLIMEMIRYHGPSFELNEGIKLDNNLRIYYVEKLSKEPGFRKMFRRREF